MKRRPEASHRRAPLPAAALAWLSAALLAGVSTAAAESPTRPLPPPPPSLAEPDPPAPEPDEAPAASPEPAPDAAPDQPHYPVGGFDIAYQVDDPNLPPVEDILNHVFQLGLADGAYQAPGPETQVVPVSLAQLAAGPTRRYRASAIQAISSAIVQHLNQRGVAGVVALPSPAHITLDGRDQRDAEQDRLTMLVHTATVGQVRTLARGDRLDEDTEAENHPTHARIVRHSPLQAGGEQGDVLRTDRLDAYLHRLNRHPGRRVEAAVAPGQRPGEVALDYLVSEQRPWLAYFQTSNTGSESIGQWRQRFGVIHHQFTHRDDILALDYLTARFRDTHAVTGSYEAPVADTELWRYRLAAAYAEFTARDVGLLGEDFSGQQWSARGDLLWNIHQHDDLFVDLVAGGEYRSIQVENQLFQQEGRTGFLLPRVGLELERRGETAETFGSLSLSYNLANAAGTELEEMRQLGRMGVREADRRFMILEGGLRHAFYLEPLLNREAFNDPQTPASSTLAHQIALAVRGQYGFKNRLAPQFQQTIGGLHTVRGYPEAILPGDSTLLASVEYRIHLPRLLPPRPPDETLLLGRPFRYAPETVHGRPDWNLMLRAFLDAGRVWSYESNLFAPDEHTLVGAGVGFEFHSQHHLGVRLDWGVPLREARGTNVGDERLHLVITVVY
ncbi:MAG: hypothetical protein WD316_11700 [Phycisphaeraceae bacterium]